MNTDIKLPEDVLKLFYKQVGGAHGKLHRKDLGHEPTQWKNAHGGKGITKASHEESKKHRKMAARSRHINSGLNHTANHRKVEKNRKAARRSRR